MAENRWVAETYRQGRWVNQILTDGDRCRADGRWIGDIDGVLKRVIGRGVEP